MCSYIQILWVILIPYAYSNNIPLQQGAHFSNYGPYKVESRSFLPCSGPKAVNLTSYTLEAIQLHNDTRGLINMTVLKPFTIDQLKITVHSVKDSKKNLLWSYKTSKPCQHYAFAMLFTEYLKSTQTCQVEKGFYVVSVNFEQTSKMFLGTSFFYGDFFFKVVTLAKQGNLLCINVHTVLSKSQ